jgi:DNA-binding SARP family transcriptional activator/tetratricopeptide (TPR) repeat protein
VVLEPRLVSVELRLLGPVEVWASGARVDAGAARQRGVLAALAVDANRPVLMETLIDRVWGEAPPAQARATVYAYVTRIRQLLGRAGGSVAVSRRSGGYQLDIAPELVDLHRFQSLVEQARRSGGPDRERALLLGQALALWRGNPLAGLSSGWADQVRHRLVGQRLDAAVEWARIQLREGDPEAVLGPVGDLAAEHLVSEPLALVLIEALAALGRTAEALDHYATLQRRLADELGIDPGPQLQRLHRAILRGTVPPPAAAPAVVVPAQLPPAASGFTGRHTELAQLDELSAAAGAPPTTVVIAAIAGTAGVGKTTLAVHWAHLVADRFPDGQLYVNLRGHGARRPTPPVQVLAQFLRALGTAPEQVPTGVGESAALYRSLLAGRRTLILLDNAASADQVRPLLPANPGCLVLITSRHRLDGLTALEGAKRLTLGMLEPPEAVGLLARRLGAARVDAEPAAAGELAQLCAYLPLALCIAAANLVASPRSGIAAYATELAKGNRLTGLAVADDQHAAIRTAFDLSYRTIPAGAQRLFRLLGLVPGPDVTAAAAAALAGTTPAEAARLLDRLASAHLIDHHLTGRYTFHDLLRLYARERSDREESAAEVSAAMVRLLDWYLYSADAARRRLYPQMVRLPLPGPRSWPHALTFDSPEAAWRWLDDERANLVAATDHAASYDDHRDYAWQLADALRGYFWVRVHGVDALATARAGLTAAQAAADYRSQTAMLVSLGMSQTRLGQYRDAGIHLARAAALARRADWQTGLASALSHLGLTDRYAGRLRDAVKHLTQALAVNRRTGRKAGQSANLANLGLVYYELGRLQSSAARYREALAIDRELAHSPLVAFKLGYLGEACHALGRTAEALDHLTTALPMIREQGDPDYEAEVLRNLADVYLTTGHLAEALEAAHRALVRSERGGDPQGVATSLNRLGACYHRLGQQREAVDHHTRSLRLAGRFGAHYARTEALIGLAASGLDLDQPASARAHAQRAVALAKRFGFRVLEGQALTAMAGADLGEDRLDDAVRRARRAVAIHRDTGHLPGQARALLVLGNGRSRAGEPAAAAGDWLAARKIFDEIGAPWTVRKPGVAS